MLLGIRSQREEYTMDLGRCVAIMEWQNCDNYLLSAIFPQAQRLPISLVGRNDSLLESLRASIRWVFIHIDLTDTSSLPEQRNDIIALLRHRGIATMNGGITHISKRNLQHACQSCGVPSVALTGQGIVDHQTTVMI